MRAHLAAFLVCVYVLIPDPTAAQSTTTGAIAGVVRDTTQAVLPGATVEASSPALIEKVRVALADDQGNYKIVDLRPGEYVVTFTLPGFTTVRREGITLSTGFTANVNAEMQVGGIGESITVTGASPVVDVQNVRTQNVLSREVLDAVPTNKTTAAFSALTLGATGSRTNHDVGGNKGEADDAVAIHGVQGQDSKLLVDGMTINHNMNQAGGSNRGIWINQAAIQETVLETSGISAEAETGGVQINFVPKDGGNQFKLYFDGNYTNSALQSSNLTDDLRSRGVRSAAEIRRIYDAAVGFGGPIVRDRLWFHGAYRSWGTQEYQPGAFFNKTADTVFFTPDLDRPAFTDLWARDYAARLTWQVAQKHRATAYMDVQRSCNCYPQVSALFAPEAMTQWRFRPYILQGTWNYPATNRLLVQAGVGYFKSRWEFPQMPNVTPQTIGIFELSPGIFYGALAGPEGLVRGAGTATGSEPNNSPNLTGRFSVSYVTGSHAFKTGLFLQKGWHHQDHTINESISYTFLNQAPISITQYATPYIHDERVNRASAYVQDQWKIDQLTLNLGLRFDYMHAYTVAADLLASRFLPARHVDAVSNVPNWKNITPRLGVAYDLRGDGRTAIKAALGQYGASMGVGIAEENHPSLALVRSASRGWTDGDRDFVPDCDLQDYRANGECQALNNQAFGQPFRNTFYDQAYLEGWDARPYNWQVSGVLQHELRRNVAVTAGYFRTWYGNFTATRNRLVTAADFSPYCVDGPSDPRLPGGGGNRICGLYDVQPQSFGRVENLVTLSSEFGEQTDTFDGIDVGVTLRSPNGALLNGGVSSGRTVRDSCYLNTRPDVQNVQLGATTPRTEGFCRVTQPWSSFTQVKFSGSYPLPLGLVASATLQNLPGIPLSANYVVPSARIQPSLGRPLSSGPNTTATIPVLEPYTMFEDRLNQLDVRLGKSFRVSDARVRAQFDIYNIFNANSVLAANATYGAAWLQPTSILGARIFKFGAHVDW